jgi:hypothetical protein
MVFQKQRFFPAGIEALAFLLRKFPSTRNSCLQKAGGWMTMTREGK